jgi:hypothetical protein
MSVWNTAALYRISCMCVFRMLPLIFSVAITFVSLISTGLSWAELVLCVPVL